MPLAYSGKQNNYGAVWVYGRNGFKWVAQAVLQSPESDSVPTSFGLTSHNGNYRSFASAIALSGNGSVLAVASGNIYYNNPYWGKVFLYKRSNNAWLLDTACCGPIQRFIQTKVLFVRRHTFIRWQYPCNWHLLKWYIRFCA